MKNKCKIKNLPISLKKRENGPSEKPIFTTQTIFTTIKKVFRDISGQVYSKTVDVSFVMIKLMDQAYVSSRLLDNLYLDACCFSLY